MLTKLVKVFDILFLNGRSLIKYALHVRKKLLRQWITEIKGRIEFATETEGENAKDIRASLDRILEERYSLLSAYRYLLTVVGVKAWLSKTGPHSTS